MKIRYAEKKDIGKVVAIHQARFQNFFLSSLGDKFLYVYYKSFLRKPAILLVLEDEGNIQGFACGNSSNQSFYKQLLTRNFFSFSMVGVYLLFAKPRSLFRIFSNLTTSGANDLQYAELLSIAALKNKKGYGSALLNAFETEVAKNNPGVGDVNISLTTDYDDNTETINFYRSNKYEELEVFTSFQNRKMYRFIKKI